MAVFCSTPIAPVVPLGSASSWKVQRLRFGEWVYCGDYSCAGINDAARAAHRAFPDAVWFRAKPQALPREPWRSCWVA